MYDLPRSAYFLHTIRRAMPSVAIIGAGPCGLVAARTFLREQKTRFDVIVFDKQDHVGGMWAVEPGEHDKMLNPDMPTNASRFAESFSDLSWPSVDLPHSSRPHLPSGYLPAFPRAWQVGHYLETYAERFIPRDVLRLRCAVTAVGESPNGDDKRWTVAWQELSSGQGRQQDFDHLIIASGFFAAPRPSELSVTAGPGHSKPNVKAVHSSRCRSLFEDVAPDNWNGEGDFLVVGGSMSGAEAATLLAFQISDRKHAPGSKPFGNPRVLHVVSRPFYAVPPLVPKMDDASDGAAFIPSDLFFFNLDRRPRTGEINAGYGRLPADKAEGTHQGLRSLIGDQRDLEAPPLVEKDTKQPAYVAITAGGMYSEFVRDGTIVPIEGRATALQRQEGSTFPAVSAAIQGKDTITHLRNIVGVVEATGYTPLPALAFLPQDIKRKLEYDEHSHRLPAILQDHQTIHPAVPGLGFVGFYEGPYWSVAEMQARVLARRWGSSASESGVTAPPDSNEEDEAGVMRDLRNAMHERASGVPQYYNGDIVGLCEQMARELDIKRNDDGFDGRGGPVATFRYCDELSDAEEASKSRQDLQDMLQATSREGRYVAWAAFRATHGEWNVHRTFNSELAPMPSGTFTGTAHFHPRVPTADNATGEYLYNEEGEFATTSGFNIRASRRYAFRYSEDTDRITSWFVKEDGGVDYLFLDLELQPKSAAPAANAWLAKASHPCSPDTYDATYEWHFDKAALKCFKVEYVVKGPQKDYVSTTWYSR